LRDCGALSWEEKEDNLNAVLLNGAVGVACFWAVCHIAHRGLVERCRADPVYLEMCVKEALRLNAPLAAMLLPRVAASEQTLRRSDGTEVRVPEGAAMHVNLVGLQTSGDSWERAGSFVPERWQQDPHVLDQSGKVVAAKGNPTSKCPMAAFFPFGFPGRHFCPGQRIAVTVILDVVRALICMSTPVVVAGEDLLEKPPEDAILDSGFDFLPAQRVGLCFNRLAK
jgi:cytochrome P450